MSAPQHESWLDLKARAEEKGEKVSHSGVSMEQCAFVSEEEDKSANRYSCASGSPEFGPMLGSGIMATPRSAMVVRAGLYKGLPETAPHSQ